MSTCEGCGATFAEPEGQEVTSSRVLCPTCVAERRRKKAAASGTTSTPTPAPSRPAKPTKAAEEPAAAPARRSRAAAKAVDDEGDGDEPASSRGDRGERVDRRQQQEEKKRRQTMIGAASIGGVTLLLGVWGFIAWRNASEHEAAAAALAAEQTKVLGELMAYDPDQPESIEKLLTRAKATASVWQISPQAGEIDNRVRRAEGKLSSLKNIADAKTVLDGIEQALPNAKTAEQLAPLAKQIAEWTPKVAKLGAEMLARHKAIGQKVQESYAQALIAGAEAAAVTPSIENLNACIAAEDALAAMIEGGSHDQVARTKLMQGLKGVRGHAEAMAQKLIEQGTGVGQWQDFATTVADWHPSMTPGFTVAAAGGALAVNGPAPEHKGMGLAVLQKHGNVRDCELDIECQLDSGAATIYLRLGQKADSKQVPAIELVTGEAKEGEVAMTPKQPATLHVRLIGGTMTVKAEGGGKADFSRAAPIAAQSGTIGIATTAGTVLQFKKLAVRTLP